MKLENEDVVVKRRKSASKCRGAFYMPRVGSAPHTSSSKERVS